ncbi:MAG: PAS domain-containing protein [Deltaproteobacteria bacterium]|nr:PAS domain-containing protein [Deltaproteobacteria bacterium]
MRLRARGKLFVAALTLVALVVLVTGAVAERELRVWLMDHLRADLARQLDAVAVATTQVAPADRARSDELADQLGAALDARVTLVHGDGTVAGDSRIALGDLASTENHRDRPEVRAALAQGRGWDQRHSATVDEDMMYAARAVHAGVVRVVRVALPVVAVEQVSARVRALVTVAGVVGLAVAVIMSIMASQLLTRTLRELVAHARSLAIAVGGAVSPSADEIGGLRGTLEQLAGELGRSVSALAAERGRLSAVLEAMDESVLALDVDGRVTLANAVARRILEVEGDPAGRTLLEVTRVPALADIVDVARTGAVTTTEITIDKSGRTAHACAAPITGTGGIVLVLHDVTEVRRLERVRRDFVANVSHELRTPVSVIRANAETLLLGAIDAPTRARAFVEAIDRNAERLARLLADLLDLARVEAGALTLDLRELPLAPVCERLCETMRERARARHQQVSVICAPDVVARADLTALEQVLLNLLDNAIKYAPTGGSITMRAHRAGERCRIEVEDDGPGIEPRHWPRLFERFYRVDAGRSREAGGTGLGLAIVKHLVEAQQGVVGVGAASPRGSIFWLELPGASAVVPESAPR